MDDEVLHGYLQHHWAGSTAGVSLFRRVAGTHTIAELGSGAGIPGLVVAMARDLEAHLYESNGKKAAFLREAARPVFEADRHAKKELKKRVRGVRRIERAVVGHKRACDQGGA